MKRTALQGSFAAAGTGDRIVRPLVRSTLLDAWRDAMRGGGGPVAAWESIQSSAATRSAYTRGRGKGGLCTADWDTVTELVAAAAASTARRHGADRIAGFPVSGGSLAGALFSRFVQLLGGVCVTEEPASPDACDAWGEPQPLLGAELRESKLVVVHGADGPTRRPEDWEALTAARSDGGRVVVLSPDFGASARFADEWFSIRAGAEPAFWESVVHVLLRELHAEQQVPELLEYTRRFTDAPFLVGLERSAERWRLGAPLPPQDAGEGLLSLAEAADEVVSLELPGRVRPAAVPVRFVDEAGARVAVATVYDLLFARFGVRRGLGDEGLANYEDPESPCTPAWQESRTGVSATRVIRFAREWAATATRTGGRCSVVVEEDGCHREAIAALMLTGCIGRRGGGFADWTGPTLRPDGWAAVALARDWGNDGRVQDAGSWRYVHAEHWRAEPASFGWNELTEAVRAGVLPGFSRVPQDARGDDIAAAEASPRVCFLHRGASVLADERFLRACLGTDALLDAATVGGARGKLDLVVSLDDQIGAGAVFADVVLPASEAGPTSLPAVLAQLAHRIDVLAGTGLSQELFTAGPRSSTGAAAMLAAARGEGAVTAPPPAAVHPFAANLDHGAPWPTATGRQTFDLGALRQSGASPSIARPAPEGTLELLVRAAPTADSSPENASAWLSEADACALGIADGEWVEVFNRNGAVCTRAHVTARVPRGLCILYERHDGLQDVPRAPSREGRRAGSAGGLTGLALGPMPLPGCARAPWPVRRLTTLVRDPVSVRRLGEPRF